MKRLIIDVECYPNYFLVLMRNEEGRHRAFEKCTGKFFDRHALLAVMNDPDVELVSFNGINYDIPMARLAIAGASLEELKQASDDIITNNLKPWQFYRKYELREFVFNHVDLMEVAPGQVGLKIYGGRLHVKHLQDLPYPPDMTLTPEQMEEVKKYCKNDLGLTAALDAFLRNQIDLRRVLSEQYHVDLRSKSDAQIAEAVLKNEYHRLQGAEPPKTKIAYDEFRYEPPEYIAFKTEQLQEVFDVVRSAPMVIQKTGHVKMPAEIEKMAITIGQSTYKIGIGGLHSQESSIAHFSDDDNVLIDRDVTSYYPNLMLNMNMSPPSYGDTFLKVYSSLVDKRQASKKRASELVKEIAKLKQKLAELPD